MNQPIDSQFISNSFRNLSVISSADPSIMKLIIGCSPFTKNSTKLALPDPTVKSHDIMTAFASSAFL